MTLWLTIMNMNLAISVHIHRTDCYFQSKTQYMHISIDGCYFLVLIFTVLQLATLRLQCPKCRPCADYCNAVLQQT